MSKISIKTKKEITPKVYAYTTPEIKRHDGWTKIGYTEREVEERVKEQTHTVDVEYKIEWWGISKFEGSDKIFKDTDFHLYLRQKGYEQEQEKDNEWFKIDGVTSESEFKEYKSSDGHLKALEAVPYHLREEQEKAVIQTKNYYRETEKGEYLWNAKPRFGKTLSVYDFCKQIGAKKVLIVTNRPSIANSWYDDYVKFLGDESGYKFVSSTDALKDRVKYKYVIHLEDFNGFKDFKDRILRNGYGCIEFVSLQDLKGSIYFGGKFDKLREVKELEWDLLVVDEAHEGVDTYKTDIAFDQINRKFTLHLSGTPFKALANDKFNERAIFNWTYADEQKAKLDWENTHKDSVDENPYEYLPKLNLLTYQLSELIKDEVSKGIDLNGTTEEYAFDLNEFFKTNSSGKFVHEDSVDKFLDSLTKLEKMPFSSVEMREELKHTFWLLYRVDSAKALVQKLKEHPIFKDYEIVLAAGDGKIDDDDENEKSFNRVVNAIKEYDKTITISVGQLTTGVTIPEWTGVLMLCNTQSPSLYMQAAFRAQNPCLYSKEGHYYRKENAYVFDFDPARTLTVFEEFANDLYSNTTNGQGTPEDRKERIFELLNFFPVIGEDEEGQMIPLDAEKVLTIPRKIRSKEVVNRGFMSDFLFQNIVNVFHAPSKVISMIERFPAIDEPKSKSKSKARVGVTENTADELNLNEKGEVNIDDKYVIGKCADCFGEKRYGISKDAIAKIAEVQANHKDEENKDVEIKDVQKVIEDSIVNPIMDIVQDKYDKGLSSKDKKKLLKEHEERTERAIHKVYAQYSIDVNTLNSDRDNKISELSSHRDEEVAIIEGSKQEDIDIANRERDEYIAKISEDKETSIKNAVEVKKAKISSASEDRRSNIEQANEKKRSDISSANESKKEKIANLADKKREDISVLKDLLRNRDIDKSDFESRKADIESEYESGKESVEAEYELLKKRAEENCELAKANADENFETAKKLAEDNFESTKRNIEVQSDNAQKQAQIDCAKKIEQAEEQYKVKKESIESDFNEKKEQAENDCDEKKKVVADKLVSDFNAEAAQIVQSVEEQSIRRVEENVKNEKKKDIEKIVRDHLRGFSRTIPSFLMAYGDENTTLKNFDKIVPPDVFKEVTDITLEEFRMLRDGGCYTDENTGELKSFKGGLFDSVVFDDSVKEFLALKDRLSNYFERTNKENIFDYIPPQRNDLIYTPKKVVKEMVDLLEDNNPGCFDNDEFTFLDPCMKSGLYITEIVTRLFNSEVLKSKYPNDDERLRHIFEKQVYGITPTQIINDIVMNFMFGFDKKNEINRKNFVMIPDIIDIVKEGKLEEKLDEIFE